MRFNGFDESRENGVNIEGGKGRKGKSECCCNHHLIIYCKVATSGEFHCEGREILRREYLNFGLQPNFLVLLSFDSLSLDLGESALSFCLYHTQHSRSSRFTFFFDCEFQRQVQGNSRSANFGPLSSLSLLYPPPLQLYHQIAVQRRNVTTSTSIIKFNFDLNLPRLVRSIPFDSTSTPPPTSTLPPFLRIPYSNPSLPFTISRH